MCAQRLFFSVIAGFGLVLYEHGREVRWGRMDSYVQTCFFISRFRSYTAGLVI
jgi:hypothetical protein